MKQHHAPFHMMVFFALLVGCLIMPVAACAQSDPIEHGYAPVNGLEFTFAF